ncbi:MAG TPA: tRNA-specific adenosine deaminase, partial [Cryobacterium sp.]|nr:tRNA-specific adenosine deaminase [Cryobacterium sp.]
MGELYRRHSEWMRLALTEARAALETGDVPVGAVVLDPAG